MRVLSLENRRSVEIARLIESYHGVPITAPAMRELPLTENEMPLRFARELMAGGIDIVVFLTGVGARALHKVISEKEPPERFI